MPDRYTPSPSEVRDAYAKRRALYLASSGHVLANDAKYDREDYAEFDRFIAQVRAETLREAAEDMDNLDDPDWLHIADGDVDVWLRARADRIEREGS